MVDYTEVLAGASSVEAMATFQTQRDSSKWIEWTSTSEITTQTEVVGWLRWTTQLKTGCTEQLLIAKQVLAAMHSLKVLEDFQKQAA